MIDSHCQSCKYFMPPTSIKAYVFGYDLSDCQCRKYTKDVSPYDYEHINCFDARWFEVYCGPSAKDWYPKENTEENIIKLLKR